MNNYHIHKFTHSLTSRSGPCRVAEPYASTCMASSPSSLDSRLLFFGFQFSVCSLASFSLLQHSNTCVANLPSLYYTYLFFVSFLQIHCRAFLLFRLEMDTKHINKCHKKNISIFRSLCFSSMLNQMLN
jgi:hypothetical protein